MNGSIDRILTTHTGSLARAPHVMQLLLLKESGEGHDPAEFAQGVRTAVAEVVQQAAIGIDVVSDGETSKIGYAIYIKDRLIGFRGEAPARPNRDMRDHPNPTTTFRCRAHGDRAQGARAGDLVRGIESAALASSQLW